MEWFIDSEGNKVANDAYYDYPSVSAEYMIRERKESSSSESSKEVKPMTFKIVNDAAHQLCVDKEVRRNTHHHDHHGRPKSAIK